MAKSAPIKEEPPQTLTTTDVDIKRVVATFKALKDYGNFTEALEKLVMRAEKLNLHRLSDDEFDALVNAESVHR